MSTLPRPPVYRIVLFQFLLVLAVGLVALICDQEAAMSAMTGGLIAAIPNAIFVLSAFRYRGALEATKAAQALYRGMAWKFVLTALMFAVIFKLGWTQDYLALFAGFAVVTLGQMFSKKIASL